MRIPLMLLTCLGLTLNALAANAENGIASSANKTALKTAGDSAEGEIRFDAFYRPTVKPGDSPAFTPRMRDLAGKRVRLVGYPAPSFRAEAEFLIFTRRPMHVCPSCMNDDQWPIDLVVVYTRQMPQEPESIVSTGVVGKLEIGPKLDPVTGMVSHVRLVDAMVEPSRL